MFYIKRNLFHFKKGFKLAFDAHIWAVKKNYVVIIGMQGLSKDLSAYLHVNYAVFTRTRIKDYAGRRLNQSDPLQYRLTRLRTKKIQCVISDNQIRKF